MKNVNMDPVTDLLLKTRERLTDPDNWCGDGPGDIESGSRCLLMTMSDIVGENSSAISAADEALLAVIYPEFSLGMWNDTHTHAEVLELLDTAIERRMKVAA